MGLDRSDLLERIRTAGVVGAGGAGFPTHRKLDAQVEHVIANGAECEPLLYKDREVMLQESVRLMEGLRLMQEITGATTVTICVKEKNADVMDVLRPLMEPLGFRSLVYPNVYPAGDEYVLVHAVTGRLIPPGGLPLHVGCVVDNVETIINVAKAVEGIPVHEKWVTVTGEVAEPKTFKVPLGTSFRECIEMAGGLTCEDPAILTGGVMMGGLSFDLEAPVTKTIGGLIVLPSDHYLVQRKGAPKETYTRVGHGQCDQCSMCTELCPRYLMGYPIEPHKVMRNLLMTGEDKQRTSLWAEFCCECNICSLIACPEQLDPKNICVDAKALLRETKTSRTEQELEVLTRGIHPARHGREVPISRLYRQLGLNPYDRPAKFAEASAQPASVRIPLRQHIGTPASSSVELGQQVKAGELIGTVAVKDLGCPVHAGIAGTVSKINGSEIIISA
ncbi:NADH dehydrogenase subunit [Puniceicoccales bacterium CK1056]|uniref:NADH dehydrogenase subunit n=1 Tax=Oceanipulchritudo coccoides TaxID=2706888 RepID=A0A6B2M1S0_9BACT|nr:4Fe-4S dicluster domain-containing protein [Oceanipulchritudo coccoides]NDV62084.1 NADH dehydrogenase subunit [Oceanipulchritudo coccoides]